MIGNGGADVVKEANAGYCASPGDYKGLAEQIRAALQNRDELQRKGASGRRFFEQHFTKEKCIDHLCDIIG